MKLSEAKDKEKLEVLNIENNEIEDKLRAMGIYEGCEVCPLMHGNGNMLLDVHGCRYAIDDDLAECIVVRRLQLNWIEHLTTDQEVIGSNPFRRV